MIEAVKLSRNRELKDRTLLRRYLDLSKYIDLLRSRALYLRRADRFTDRFEGALTPAIRRAIDSARDSASLGDGADTFYRRSRMGTFVSCWTLGAQDNMALWKLYGGASTSVAIVTTAMKLTSVCLGWEERVVIEKVQYIDHFESPDMVIGDYVDPLRFKHEAYEFEREVRILLSRQDNWEGNPESIQLPLGDLDELITSVVVAPEAGGWFFDIVGDVTRRYGVKAPVKRSQLSALPE